MSSSRSDMENRCFRFLLHDATAHLLPVLMCRDAGYTRLYRHIPSPELSWWEALVPLVRNGPLRKVVIRGLEFDLDLRTADFLNWIDDFRAGGMTLIQSDRLLLPNMSPWRIRRESTYLKVLGQCGARLLVELPHRRETAGVTLFDERDVQRLKAAGFELIPEA